MGYPTSKYYGTTCEIDFIRKLGTGVFRKPDKPRLEILKGYLSGTRKRVKWCGMNHEEIIHQIENEIFLEEY